MPGGAVSELPGVVEVLDRKGIVEVRSHGNVRDLAKPGAGRVPGDDRRSDAGRRAREPRRAGRRDGNVPGHLPGLRLRVGHEQERIELGPERPRELERADSHSRHAGPDRLRREHDDALHCPRRRSSRRCSFQVFEP